MVATATKLHAKWQMQNGGGRPAKSRSSYIDLLFYHLHLRAFVVIELKARKFVPEYAGKLNFYLSAVDDLMRKPGGAPSIGLILCKTRNKVIAEYALRHISRLVGVAQYITRLTEELPKELVGQLPTVQEIEAELSSKRWQRRPAAETKKKSRDGSAIILPRRVGAHGSGGTSSRGVRGME